MQLRPVTRTDGPTYPSRKRLSRGGGGWIRATTAAMAAAAGIWVSGCIGVTTGGDIAAPNFFHCAESMPDERPVLSGPDTVDGELCGEGTAWASIEVEQSYSARLEIIGSSSAVAHIIDPEGYEVATLTPDESSIDLELTSGTWTLAVDSESDSFGYFTFSLSEI